MAGPGLQSGRVRFDPTVQFDRPKTARHYRKSPKTTTETFREFESPNIPDTALVEAAHLFSNHYGIWNTPIDRKGGKQGTIFPTALRTRPSW